MMNIEEMSKDVEEAIKEEKLQLTNFEINQLERSRYINPFRVTFSQNNCQRIWDGVMAHSGVSCLIYNLDKECLILVKQFRPVVYVNKLVESHDTKVNVFDTNLDWSRVHPDEGFTYELCAGLCDKDKSLHETIREEIMEECGYSVCTENIHKIAQARSVGLFGAMHTSFYTEVRESDKTGPGGGNSDEGEFIELYELPIGQIKSFIGDHKYEKPLGVLYALKWFLYERDEFLATI